MATGSYKGVYFFGFRYILNSENALVSNSEKCDKSSGVSLEP